MNAIHILLPRFNENQLSQMTNSQKADALDTMTNILIGVFENTEDNDIFDETSRLGNFSIWNSDSRTNPLESISSEWILIYYFLPWKVHTMDSNGLHR